MGLTADGSCVCDRCGVWLPGMGVIEGLVTTDATPDGDIRRLIFCYRNNCRDHLLAGLVTTAPDPSWLGSVAPCTHCGVATERCVTAALLASDIDPDTPTAGNTRQMLFGHGCGGRDLLLGRILT